MWNGGRFFSLEMKFEWQCFNMAGEVRIWMVSCRWLRLSLFIKQFNCRKCPKLLCLVCIARICYKASLGFLFSCHLHLGEPHWLTLLFVSIELQLQEINPAVRNGVYSHLEAFVPCNKDTLIKRLKKLHLNVQVTERLAPAWVIYVTVVRIECRRVQQQPKTLYQLLNQLKSCFFCVHAIVSSLETNILSISDHLFVNEVLSSWKLGAGYLSK